MAFYGHDCIMEHLYKSDFLGDDNITRRFVFRLEEIGKMGWGMCRIIEIHDIYPDGIRHSIDYYVPAIHDGGSHYMSSRYKCRYNRKNLRLVVFMGGGDPPWNTSLFLRRPCTTCLEETPQTQRTHAPEESHSPEHETSGHLDQD